MGKEINNKIDSVMPKEKESEKEKKKKKRKKKQYRGRIINGMKCS